MTIQEFQRLIEEIYFQRDSARGRDATFVWFVEEIGELARAVGHQDRSRLEEEFADVLAWLSTLASIEGVDLEKAATRKYGSGCPKCRRAPCACPDERGDVPSP